MKVVILTKDSVLSYFAVNHLIKDHNYFVITEKEQNLFVVIKKFKRFIRNNGLAKGCFLCCQFLLEAPFILKEAKKTDNFLKGKLGDSSFNYSAIRMDSVNNPKIIDIVDKINPEVIIDIGTNIVKKDIISFLKKSQRFFINWHMGITPKYRGCQSEFWAVCNNDFDEIGSTIHHLDAGVDTGGIILQGRVKLEQNEKQFQRDYRFLRYKNVLLGVDLLNQFLRRAEANNFDKCENIPEESNCFSTPRKKDYQNYYRIFKGHIRGLN